MLDAVRYWLAWLLVVFLPPAILYWFVIHPFARFWRRAGRNAGLVAGLTVLMASAFAIAQVAPLWLTREYGFSWPLAALGIGCLALAMIIQVRRRRHLTMRILMGLPELSREPGESRLLSEGIYARVRHPRYVEVVLGSLGYALIADYLAGYVVVALSALAIYVVVLIEEPELHARFGREWEEYAARTPRFVPRRRGRERRVR